MSPAEFESLVAEHGRAWRILAAQWSDAADDCVQEALLRLIREDPKPENPFAWVTRVIRNIAMSQHRRRETQVKHQPELQSRELTRTAVRSSEAFAWSDVSFALEELPTIQRQTVVMKVWGEMTFSEIAQIMNCGTTTAHRHFQEGLDQLRMLLGDSTPAVPATLRANLGELD